jgi:hypothetical protein
MTDKIEMDNLKLQIETWEKVVDVQMHFNDLCLRIRSFAISILGVLLGSSAIAYRFAGFVEVCNFKFHTSAIFISISIIVWLSFYFMDRFWYHELLRGAVHHGRAIEDDLEKYIPNISLAKAIRKTSHESLKMNAAKKLSVFYVCIAIIQIIGLIVVLSGVVKIAS